VVPLHVCVLLADEHELQGVGLGILPNLQKHLAGDGAARVDGELIELDAEGARARGVAHYGAVVLLSRERHFLKSGASPSRPRGGGPTPEFFYLITPMHT
jgi:hypothetical protein